MAKPATNDIMYERIIFDLSWEHRSGGHVGQRVEEADNGCPHCEYLVQTETVKA